MDVSYLLILSNATFSNTVITYKYKGAWGSCANKA